MKITLGYFGTNDGNFLGTSKPSDCQNYYLVMGTIRKKICEHPDTSPYRKHALKPWCKTYSDAPRMDISIHEYRNNNKHKNVKIDGRWWDIDEDTQARIQAENAKLTRMIQFLINNSFPQLFEKYGIRRRYVYLPGWFDLNWGALE